MTLQDRIKKEKEASAAGEDAAREAVLSICRGEEPPKPEWSEEQDAREDEIFRKVMDIHLEEESKEILRDMEVRKLLALTPEEVIERYKDYEPEEPLPPFDEFMKKVEARQAAQKALEDEADLKAYEEAMEEYRKNPVTYSHEEVK